jgi:NitT/TauT family transport system permease protein
LSRLKATLAQIWPRVAIVLVVVLVWWAVVATGYWNRIIVPAPAAVWTALTSHLTGAQGLLVAAERSIFRLFVSLVVAVGVGTPIGMSMAASKIVQRSVGSVMAGLQALPPISWLPLAIVWFGFTEKAVVFVVIVGVVPAVAIATAASVRLVAPSYVRTGRTLGASGWRLYSRVVLPAAVPGYMAGLQQAWAIAWRALMAAELLQTGARGLGHLIFKAGAELDTPLVLATMVAIMAVGVGIDLLFALVDRRVRARRGLLVA